MKFCNKCSTNKPETDFNKRSDSAVLRSHCKVCCSKDNSARSASKCNRRKPKSSPETIRELKRLASKRYNSKPERKGKQAFYEATRRAKKLHATPKWLTASQIAHIKCYYDTARQLSELFDCQMDIDHVVPLKGKNVSGLHVPWNLQIMRHEGNLLKTNKLEAQSE